MAKSSQTKAPEIQTEPLVNTEVVNPVEIENQPEIVLISEAAIPEMPHVSNQGHQIVVAQVEEINKKLSHKQRIIAFLETRKGAGKIKLNDFLKSLYPLAKGNEKPFFTVQGNMKKLKQDLMELRAEGDISFVNDSFERLGKAFFPDHATGKTHYYDVTNLIIEVEIS